jgi:hypothetical protein
VFSRLKLLLLVPLAALGACDSSATVVRTVNMHFERANFYDAPFPSDDLVRADGTIDIDGFPDPDGIQLVEEGRQLIKTDAHGFAASGGVFFTLSDAIDPSVLPALAATSVTGSSVALVGVTKTAPDYLRRYPVQLHFDPDGGPFGAPNLVTMLPLQGAPLRPKTTYAAVLTRELGLTPSAEMAAIAAGTKPDAMPAAAFAEYSGALAALPAAGIAPSDVAGLAVFTTDAPTAGLDVVAKAILQPPLPVPDAAFHRTDLFDDYCVYATTIDMPDYQQGVPPFTSVGGAWAFDAYGQPVVQRYEKSNLVVTIPRSPMPAAGYPVVEFIRTGAGGDRPLVDRGTEATNGGPSITPGTGPAYYFAHVGFAGASVDGPLGGLRNTTMENEDYTIFNVFNAPALRDNVRESAAELVLFAHIMAALRVDAGDCPGATGAAPARFDATKVALMGHSMGATIAPLVLAEEPMLGAVVLSGAGSSWIENIVYKQQPLYVRPAFEALLEYPPLGRTLTEFDPVVTIFQWAEEPADPLVYDARIIREPVAGGPRHVLMEQGIVDHYIMPPIANSTSLSLGLDLAGMPLDAITPEIESLPSLESLLPFSGRSQIALPASANEGGGGAAGVRSTGVVLQHPADGIEDGHEIVFQTDPPKREYRCFLQSFAATGMPVVPPPGDVLGPCL